MNLRMTRNGWLIGAGAGALLLTGAVLGGPVASLAQGGGDAKITEDEAIEAAVAAFPDTSAAYIERDDDDGRAIYEVVLSNGVEVEVDGDNGRVLDADGPDDDRDDDDDRDEVGTIDDGAILLSEATITVDEAIAAAQTAAEGRLGDIDLEYVSDRLVFNIDIGNHDVLVDANDGSIVTVRADD